MTAYHRNPAILTRRSTLGLLLAGLTASSAEPVMRHMPAVIEAVKVESKKVARLAAPLFDWPSLTALAQKMVSSKLTPGLSLSVMHAGGLLYSQGFGLANIEAATTVTPQTGFRIASITKQFTAAAILLLAEDGKLSLDDTLARFIPEFPRATDITLRQMLSHTSGLGDYINGQSLDILVEAQQGTYTSDELIHIISAKKPLFRAAPGRTWLYSNSAFALLGIVVERLSGLAFADFCQRHLFVPAGLEQTAIDTAYPLAGNSNGYRPDYKAPHSFDTNTPVSPSFIGGAGAIRSTTEDLCLWHCALLSGKILKPASLHAMLTPTLLKDGAPAYERRGNEPMEYGLGMGLGTMENRRIAAHGGRVNGFTGHLRSFTSEKLTVAILYNSDGGGAPGFQAIQKALRTEASRLALDSIGLS